MTTFRTLGKTKIVGNTFKVKDQLRAMGGVWSASDKAWYVPNDKAEEAQKLAGSGPVQARSRYTPRTCKDCGCKINYGVYCGKCEYR
jgi:hypothetical protein